MEDDFQKEDESRHNQIRFEYQRHDVDVVVVVVVRGGNHY